MEKYEYPAPPPGKPYWVPSDNELLTAMIGRTPTKITGAKPGSEEVVIEFLCGTSLRLYHQRDCCETVQVADVIGDPDDLLGASLTMCEASTEEGHENDWGSSTWTWTFYKLATNRGYVTLRFLGESNGYYSERVSVSVNGR